MQASTIAFAKQRDLFRQLEVISNNIANSNSNGFKADLAVYTKSDKQIDGLPDPTPDMVTATNTMSGGLITTERPLDVAIDGNGYFVVETPLGTRYTRNGGLAISADGSLVDAKGNPISGSGGAITMDASDEDVEIGQNGEVYGMGADGRNLRGTLQVVKFENESTLQKVGDNYFKSDITPVESTPIEDYKIVQGAVEGSNVNQISELTELIDISRTVSTLARIVQDQSQMLRSAFNRITGTGN